MLVSRLSVWLCALLAVGGQGFSREQPLSVIPAPGTNSSAPGCVALRWNPSPDTNATGYFVCWGLASAACTNRLEAGNATTVSIGGLESDLTYYFSVVAYDAAGRESPPSNEITHRIPARAPVRPAPMLSHGANYPRHFDRPSSTPGGAPALSLGPPSSRQHAAALCLSFHGAAGKTCRLEATRDFIHWDTLWTTNCASDRRVVFELTDTGHHPHRFYRLRQE